jgi:hypothetical protein
MNKKNIISIFGFNFIIATIILLLLLSTAANNNNNVAFSQHEMHEAQTSQVFDSVTVLLDGKSVPPKNFIALYTSAPSKIASAHLGAQLPCDDNGVTKLKILGGIMPNVPPLNMTLDLPMSTLGMVCMYHLDIMQQNDSKITDIALQNPTDEYIILPAMTSVVIHVAAIQTGSVEEEHMATEEGAAESSSSH